jgi:hypothetical protein
MGEADNTAGDDKKRCRCGYAKGDGMIVEEPRYSFSGTMALLFGITARPIAVRHQCRKCGEVLDLASDPESLSKYHT